MSSGPSGIDQQTLRHYIENATIPLQQPQAKRLARGPVAGRRVLDGAFWQELGPQQDRLAILSAVQAGRVLHGLVDRGDLQVAAIVLTAIYEGSLPQVQQSAPSSAEAYKTLTPPKDALTEYGGRTGLATWLGMTVLRSMVGDLTQAIPGAACSPLLEAAITNDPLWDAQNQSPSSVALLRGFQLLEGPWSHAQVSRHGFVLP